MHTDYVVWDPITHFLPPTLTHASACVGAVGVAMPYSMWIGCGYADMCGVYGRIELLRIPRAGAPACGAHPPLPCPASQWTKSFH